MENQAHTPYIPPGCLYCSEAMDGCCCSVECATSHKIENQDDETPY